MNFSIDLEELAIVEPEELAITDKFSFIQGPISKPDIGSDTMLKEKREEKEPLRS